MKKSSKLMLAAAAVAATMAGACPSALAQSADALIDKLVDKGVLSVKEANELREEADKNFAQAYSVKSGMSEWVSALNINGDFRGRYDAFFVDQPGFVERHRFRYRARIAIKAMMTDGLEVGFRLGSGDLDSGIVTGTDPLSLNQSFQNNGSKKGVFLDQAYVKWTPVNSPDLSVATVFGKMENPFQFLPTEMVFDNDYTPEGLAIQMLRPLGEKHELSVVSGAFVLDELSSDTEDPVLFGAQARLNSKWTPEFSTSFGAAYLAIVNPERLGNPAVPNIAVGNTRNAGGFLVYDYNPVVVDASATYQLESFPLYTGAFPIMVYGEYIINEGASDAADNEAWAAGVKFGKSGKRNTWELAYTYKWFGADAWWEELIDSNAGAYYGTALPNTGLGSGIGYRTGTNIKGHVLRLAYSLSDSFTVSTRAMLMERIDIPENSEALRMQVDAQWKF